MAADAPVTPEERACINGHRGGVLWLTGLSGAGKSTLSVRLLRALTDHSWRAAVLDGDALRSGLNADLGFAERDREENVRRTAEVSRLMAEAGLVVIAALISPLAAHRTLARRIVAVGFHEVHVRAPLALCEARDPKGLYRRARAGQLAQFTGVSAPYEAPADPDLVIDTAATTVETSVATLTRYAMQSFGPGTG